MNLNFSFIIPILSQSVFLVMLSFVVVGDPFIRRDHKKVLLLAILLTGTTMASSSCEYVLSVGPAEPGRIFLRTLFAVYGYIIRPVLIVLCHYILADRKDKWLFWGLISVNAAVFMTALFCPLAFTISDSNQFIRGPLGYTCHFIAAILLIFLLKISYEEYSTARRWEMVIPFISVSVIFFSVALDLVQPVSSRAPVPALNSALVFNCVFFYIWLHLQLVRRHEEAVLSQQRIQIMMSQIQPHFLYNTLTTIQSLCLTDPEKAFDVTEKFGLYLRQNIDSMNQLALIPIERELEHTRIYAQIEAVRFPHITICYDIQDSGFGIPALTIQPIVENAIRHGVRIREDGRIRVSVQKIMQKQDVFHEITVSDNGKGFDVQALWQADDSHIGIRNVKERLERMCGGSLAIESRIDQGTTVRIRIPVRQDNEKR